MGLKDNRRGLWKTPEDDGYRGRLKKGARASEHNITLKKEGYNAYQLSRGL